MKCKKCESLLMDFLEYRLDEEETEAVKGHLQKCEKCKTLWILQKQIKSTIGKQEERTLPSTFHSDLMRKLETEEQSAEKEKTKMPKVLNRKAYYRKISYLGGLAAVFAAGVFLIQSGQFSSESLGLQEGIRQETSAYDQTQKAAQETSKARENVPKPAEAEELQEISKAPETEIDKVDTEATSEGQQPASQAQQSINRETRTTSMQQSKASAASLETKAASEKEKPALEENTAQAASLQEEQEPITDEETSDEADSQPTGLESMRENIEAFDSDSNALSLTTAPERNQSMADWSENIVPEERVRSTEQYENEADTIESQQNIETVRAQAAACGAQIQSESSETASYRMTLVFESTAEKEIFKNVLKSALMPLSYKIENETVSALDIILQ